MSEIRTPKLSWAPGPWGRRRAEQAACKRIPTEALEEGMMETLLDALEILRKKRILVDELIATAMVLESAARDTADIRVRRARTPVFRAIAELTGDY